MALDRVSVLPRETVTVFQIQKKIHVVDVKCHVVERWSAGHLVEEWPAGHVVEG